MFVPVERLVFREGPKREGKVDRLASLTGVSPFLGLGHLTLAIMGG